MVGPPDQGVEQTESLRLARLKGLRSQGHQGAGQGEAAVSVRWGVVGAANGPGQFGWFDPASTNARVARRQPVQSVSWARAANRHLA